MRNAVLFFIVAATVACQSKTETTTVSKPAEAMTPAASSGVSPAPVASTTPAAAPGEIGIAECDAYISKWESCLATKITGDAKEQTRVALDATREGWKKMAASPESRVHLAAACKEASEVAVMQVGAYGCTW